MSGHCGATNVASTRRIGAGWSPDRNRQDDGILLPGSSGCIVSLPVTDRIKRIEMMKNIYCISICIVLHSETVRFGLRNGLFCDAKRPVLQRQTIGFAKRLKFNELQTRFCDKSIPNYFYNSFSRSWRTKSTIVGINQP